MKYFFSTIILALSAVLTGCPLQKTDSGTSTVPTTTNSSASTTSSACTTSTIDQGQKGTAAATQRGTFSDIAMIPSTSYYATVYNDPNAIAIKLSYWNGSNYVIETVSGEGAGTFIKLAFRSDGVPFVFWVSGTRVRGASRSLALTTSDGVWTGATIDTGVAPRALDASVSPNNDILLTFLTGTAATVRGKIAICPGTCASATGFLTMTPNAYVENTNVVTAGFQTGAAWCNAGSGTYYPVAVFPLTAAVRYVSCLNSAVGCLNSASWSAGNVVAAAGVAADL